MSAPPTATALTCPFCGARELTEFVFRQTIPEAESDAVSAVYARRNCPRESFEYWQHVGGCRAWLRVRRDPSTGHVYDVRLLGGAA